MLAQVVLRVTVNPLSDFHRVLLKMRQMVLGDLAVQSQSLGSKRR